MNDQSHSSQGNSGNPFATVPIEITVSVGRARPLIKDLVTLGIDAVLELDRKVDDPVELHVGDKLIARGTLEDTSVDGSGALSVRLTEILGVKDGFV